MADIFDSWFGESGYQPGGLFDSSWQFSNLMAAHLRQQGDRAEAAQGLGTVGQLYALQDANKQKEQQSIFQLASTLGMLGLGGLGAFGGFGYAR